MMSHSIYIFQIDKQKSTKILMLFYLKLLNLRLICYLFILYFHTQKYYLYDYIVLKIINMK